MAARKGTGPAPRRAQARERASALTAPMLATPGPIPADPSGYAFEYKWDGMRALVGIRGGRLRIMSRNGLDQTDRFPELAGLADAATGHDLVIDGEIVAFDAKGRPDFGRLQNRFGLTRTSDIKAQAQAHPAHFLAFDLLYKDGRDLTGKPYRVRRRALESLGLSGPNWAVTPSHVAAGKAMLQSSRDLGLEGIMAKRLESPYLPGRRSSDWLKVRNRNRQEFVVGAWTEGGGSRTGIIGSLLVGYHPRANRDLRYIGRVGSGFTRHDLAGLMVRLLRLASLRNPFDSRVEGFGKMGKGLRVETVHFLKPQLVVETEFNGLSRHGLLRQASFKGIRTDKSADDVVWEQWEVNGKWQERSGAEPSVSAS